MDTSPAVALRPFRSTDRSFFAGMAGDARVTRFVGDGQPWSDGVISTRTDAALQLLPVEQLGMIRWFIAENADEPVGLVVSTRREKGVEIGYWVTPEHWGRGIAGAMVDETIAMIPGLFGVSSLIARVDPGNTVSVRLLSRRGFTFRISEDGLDEYVRNVRPHRPTCQDR